MLVYIISTSYPDAEFPTKNIFVYEQAKELASRGHRIVVLHVKKLASRKLLKQSTRSVLWFDDGFAHRYLINQKTFLASRLHALNKFLFLNSVERLYKKAVYEEGKPDIIYAHFSCWAGVAAARLSKREDIPLVTLEHYGGLLSSKISRVMKKGIEETICQSDFYMCVSDGLKQSIINKVRGDHKIIVLPNMIDRQFHYVAPKKNKNFVFLGVGNLYKAKGFDLLIRSFCKAFLPTDDVELKIGGDGPDKRKLKDLIESSGRNHQIKLLGRLKRESTIEEYVNCNCFVLASYHETYGMVYREALITGRPIITTNHGGFSGSDWHDEYGYIIPVGDEIALVNSLKKMVKEYSNFNPQMISSVCARGCSADVVGDKIDYYLHTAYKKHFGKTEL